MLFVGITASLLAQTSLSDGNRYVILAAKAVVRDTAWAKVVTALQARHQAEVVTYEDDPEEALPDLKRLCPRYVAVVEQPERIGPDYVLKLHRLSRKVDEDVFVDFVWGIITGHDARSAMRLVEGSAAPLVVKNALSTVTDLGSGKWFTRYGRIDPAGVTVEHPEADLLERMKAPKLGLWAEKTTKEDTLTDRWESLNTVPDKFFELYGSIHPDLVLTIAGDYQQRLVIRPGINDKVIRAKDRKLYEVMSNGERPLPLDEYPKVYFPLGSSSADIGHSAESLPLVWMDYGRAAALVGYQTLSWHGQAGWGTWKFWATNAGRYTLAQALFLNQQYMLNRLQEWNAGLPDYIYPYQKEVTDLYEQFQQAVDDVRKKLGMGELSLDQMGYLYDKDVFVYYGDPAWEVRLDTVAGENDFQVTWEKRKDTYVVTITTSQHFSRVRMQGDYFKEEGDPRNPVSIGRLPFSYFFPERLQHPVLAKKLKFDGKLTLDENFLFIEDSAFEPGKKYKLIIKCH